MTTLDTEKIDLYTPEHYLLNFRDMTMEALAVVTDEDMNEYEEEHAIYLAKQKEATTTAYKVYRECETNFEEIFGRNSNEHKYLQRAFKTGKVLTDVHAREVPSPETIRSKVNDARGKVDVSKFHTSSTIEERGISEINHALEYLINNGFKLNRDFTLANAVSVATSHKSMNTMKSVVMNDMKMKMEDVVVDETCSEEECATLTQGFSIRTSSNQITATCDCHELEYKVNFEFGEGGEATTNLLAREV